MDIKHGHVVKDAMTDKDTDLIEQVIKQKVSWLQFIRDWIVWTAFLPITIPLESTKFGISIALKCMLLFWSLFVVANLVAASIFVYFPCIGHRLAQICLLPAVLNAIPEQPLVRFAIDMLKIPIQPPIKD